MVFQNTEDPGLSPGLELLFYIVRSPKGHSRFTSSVNGWLGFKFSDIFIWLPTGLRDILKSELQIVLLIVILICSIYFTVKLLMFCITKIYKNSNNVYMKDRNNLSSHCPPPMFVIRDG